MTEQELTFWFLQLPVGVLMWLVIIAITALGYKFFKGHLND